MKTFKETIKSMVDAHNAMATAVKGCDKDIQMSELFELWIPLGSNETKHSFYIRAILDKYGIKYKYNASTNIIKLLED